MRRANGKKKGIKVASNTQIQMANLPSGPVALLLSLAPPSSYHMLKITPRAAWPIENATHAHVLESAAQRPLYRELRHAGRVCRFDVLTQV